MSEQAVTTDNPKADAPNEGTEDKGGAGDARDEDLDLDALLEASQAEGESVPETTSESAPDDVAARLAALEKDNKDNRRVTAQKEADVAINAAATEIKGLSADLEHVSERAIKGQLYLYAEEKPGVLKAFSNRDANPKAWNDVKRAIAKEIAKDLGGGGADDDLTAGIKAVKDAVRGVSHKSAADEPFKPDNKELSSKTDQEFAAWKDENREKLEAGATR
ncbi:hypothetical protein LCGC14_2372620 [marine sediment metagenome]|uniref:Scaffolding protein n=1 Tax=marine sediment metagenome TaxID=412755 RepID=A0A0F9EFS8_9ZZZZ